MVKVNGKMSEIAGTIESYLIAEGYNISRVAVELNGEIVSKSDFGKVELKDGDSLEVVSFVGGG